MKMEGHHCRFCGIQLSNLHIDDDYSRLRDPYKLMRLAACNRCASLRERKRGLTERFRSAACRLVGDPKNIQLRDQIRVLMEELLKRYMELVEEWVGCPKMDWDDAIVEAIVKDPKNVESIVGRVWLMAPRQQELV